MNGRSARSDGEPRRGGEAPLRRPRDSGRLARDRRSVGIHHRLAAPAERLPEDDDQHSAGDRRRVTHRR